MRRSLPPWLSQLSRTATCTLARRALSRQAGLSRQKAGTSANRSGLAAKPAGLRETNPHSLPTGLPPAGRNYRAEVIGKSRAGQLAPPLGHHSDLVASADVSGVALCNGQHPDRFGGRSRSRARHRRAGPSSTDPRAWSHAGLSARKAALAQRRGRRPHHDAPSRSTDCRLARQLAGASRPPR
jgi:hypothetical protein